jgi:hypothetical protein
MKNQNQLPAAHLFFELRDPAADLYIWQLETDGRYEMENVKSYTWEQLLEISLKTLSPSERVEAKTRIAGSLRKFLGRMESQDE